ncbi:MAG: caspase family protein [Myxococcaceae bacterium]|nr:caspase family protein [Myxococcaceae bacterium]
MRPLVIALLVPFSVLAQEAAAPAAVPHDANDVALIVGIEKYAFVEKVAGAKQNALDWNDYLKARGATTYLLLDNEATDERIMEAAKKVAADAHEGKRVWFIFIGHGAPMPPKTGPDGKLTEGESGLVAVDAQQDAKSLQNRSVPLSAVLAELSKGPQRETVAVVDACFSGKTSSGSLAPGLQPLIALRSVAKARVVQMTAGKSDEFAGPLPGYGRPAFTYLMLGALKGWGDANTDGVVTSREAVDYAQDVLRRILTDRNQTPELTGEDVQLGQSLGEKGPSLDEFQAKAREANIVSVSTTGAPVVNTGRRTAGWVTLGVGGAVGVVAIILGQVASGTANAAQMEQSAATATTKYGEAKTLALVTDIGFGLAAAAAVTGIVLVATSSSGDAVVLSPFVSSSVAGAALSGRF